jgi:hypothetical protein
MIERFILPCLPFRKARVALMATYAAVPPLFRSRMCWKTVFHEQLCKQIN